MFLFVAYLITNASLLIYRRLAGPDWPTTQGTVAGCRLVTGRRIMALTPGRMQVSFHYSIGDKILDSEQDIPVGSFDANKYHTGGKVIVHYNPYFQNLSWLDADADYFDIVLTFVGALAIPYLVLRLMNPVTKSDL